MVALLVVRARARISTALSTGVERARSIPRSGVFLDGSSARAVYSMTAAASCRPTRRKASILLDEADVSAAQHPAQARTRFLGTDAYQERAPRAGGSPEERPQAAHGLAVSLQSLKRRADFARVRGRGRRFQSRRLAVYSLMKREGPVRLGIVVGREVGSAVVRNLVRRRLREAARRLVGSRPRDIVIIARPESARADFAELSRDLAEAL